VIGLFRCYKNCDVCTLYIYFTQVQDKRVSRNHGVLEVENGELFLTPVSGIVHVSKPKEDV